jgi:3-isopropylmalate/(R)-2-methylmalate dehydratase small subunit
MQPFVKLASKAAPFMLPNIDTDIITPMHRLMQQSDKPLSYYAFEPYRYLDGNADTNQLNPDFCLNQPAYDGALILITGENFGCGSSRESAPAAMVELGIRCIIGASFGEIFFNNCFQRGLLPIQIPADLAAELADQSLEGEFTVDLETQKIVSPRQAVIAFDVNPLRKTSLLSGLDDIDLTLQREEDIAEFQAQDSLKRPWIYQLPGEPGK